jgi:hypothetical protein
LFIMVGYNSYRTLGMLRQADSVPRILYIETTLTRSTYRYPVGLVHKDVLGCAPDAVQGLVSCTESRRFAKSDLTLEDQRHVWAVPLPSCYISD